MLYKLSEGDISFGKRLPGKNLVHSFLPLMDASLVLFSLNISFFESHYEEIVEFMCLMHIY